MVDPEQLRRTLQRASDRLEVLRPYAGMDAGELLTDDVRLGHVKYTFQTAIEACVDAAQHVCAANGWGPPKDNADAMRVLAKHGAVDGELGETMAAVVGFRNILVHDYDEVDDERVVANLQRRVDVLDGLDDVRPREDQVHVNRHLEPDGGEFHGRQS